MQRFSIAFAVVAVFAIGCDGPDPAAPGAGDASLALLASVSGPVVHMASVGGADINLVEPGEDANFSLTAVQHADGSVKGQWHDQFAGGAGIHVDVDCLHVVGNQAWVSGVITQSPNLDFVGLPAITRVSDDGTSQNDPTDRISFSFIGVGISCEAAPGLPLFPVNNGQVKVK